MGIKLSALSLAIGLVLSPPMDPTRYAAYAGIAVPNPAIAITASLFGAGEKGLFYDLSDFSTLFQDIAGTIPVTAVGQFVGKILDKSGNGNHWAASTSGKRPILTSDGVYYMLVGDGTDDFGSSIADVDFGTSAKISVFMACSKITGQNNKIICSLGAVGSVGSFRIYANGGSIENYDVGSLPATSASFRLSRASSSKDVLSVQIDNSVSNATLAAQLSIRLNGAAVTVIGAGSNAGPFVPGKVTMLGSTAGASNHPGGVYSLIMREGLTSSPKVTQVEAFLSLKSGVFI